LPNSKPEGKIKKEVLRFFLGVWFPKPKQEIVIYRTATKKYLTVYRLIYFLDSFFLLSSSFFPLPS